MSFDQLKKAYQVITKLRDPDGGCPWDLEQTHESLIPYAIEEAYEFKYAVTQNNDSKMEEELGDMLLQVILHCVIGKERGAFDLESVSKSIADKIVHRHPHVFGENAKKISYEEVKNNWEALKAQEKNKKENKYYIDEEILFAPSLVCAEKIGKKTEKVNFDWEDYHQVTYKVEEEWQELKEELTPHRELNRERVKEELGDLLFSVTQLARHLDLSAEECLFSANQKFLNRFQKVEDLINDEKKSFADFNQNELEKFWTEAKQKVKP